MTETGRRQQGVWIAAGALHGGIALATSAFAAHGLEARLGPDALGWIETGARVQMFHGLALLAMAGLSVGGWAAKWLGVAGWGFFLGAALFAGSLYLRAAAGFAAVAPVTPIGGALLILSWICLLICGVGLAWKRP